MKFGKEIDCTLAKHRQKQLKITFNQFSFAGNNGQIKYIDKVTDFNGVDVQLLKKDFRQAINEIANEMSEEEKLAFIEESNQVFLMNNLIVNSVGGQNKVLCNIMYKTSAVFLVVAAVIFAYKWHK